jgi:hypothetical protein
VKTANVSPSTIDALTEAATRTSAVKIFIAIFAVSSYVCWCGCSVVRSPLTSFLTLRQGAFWEELMLEQRQVDKRWERKQATRDVNIALRKIDKRSWPTMKRSLISSALSVLHFRTGIFDQV